MTRSKVYDLLWGVADGIFKCNNVCDYVDGACRHDRLVGTVGQCCQGCKYLGVGNEGRCTVEALGCKLYACRYLQDHDPWLKGYLDALKDVAAAFGIPTGYRDAKSDLLKECKVKE
jgi:hypothetical protein